MKCLLLTMFKDKRHKNLLVRLTIAYECRIKMYKKADSQPGDIYIDFLHQRCQIANLFLICLHPSDQIAVSHIADTNFYRVPFIFIYVIKIYEQDLQKYIYNWIFLKSLTSEKTKTNELLKMAMISYKYGRLDRRLSRKLILKKLWSTRL